LGGGIWLQSVIEGLVISLASCYTTLAKITKESIIYPHNYKGY